MFRSRGDVAQKLLLILQSQQWNAAFVQLAGIDVIGSGRRREDYLQPIGSLDALLGERDFHIGIENDVTFVNDLVDGGSLGRMVNLYNLWQALFDTLSHIFGAKKQELHAAIS